MSPKLLSLFLCITTVNYLAFQDLSVLVNKMSQDTNLEGSYYYFQFRARIVEYARFNCLRQENQGKEAC